MIRAVFFDAVGTVLELASPVADVYREAAARHGLSLASGVVRERMKSAHRRQENLDRTQGYATSEEREWHRWHAVVTETFADSPDREAIFDDLHQWYAGIGAWRVYADVAAVLSQLQDRKIPFGLASNFDSRLRGIVGEFAELHCFRKRMLISSEVGHRKPSREFFDAIIQSACVPADEILFVGDDRENDFDGAMNAGMTALLIERQGLSDRDNGIIGHLSEIFRYFPTR